MFAIAFLSLAVACIATRFASKAARSAADQVELQEQLAKEAAQPYVWADVRPSKIHGSNLRLLVGNSGRTLARNVRLTVDKQLPTQTSKAADLLEDALRRFQEGHASIAPGREWSWSLGFGGALLGDKNEDLRFTFTINADGPFGPIPELSYSVDMNDWRGSTSEGEGSLALIRKSILELKTSVSGIREALVARPDEEQ